MKKPLSKTMKALIDRAHRDLQVIAGTSPVVVVCIAKSLEAFRKSVEAHLKRKVGAR